MRKKHLKLRWQIYGMYILILIVPLTIIGGALVMSAYNMMNDTYMELLKSENMRVKSIMTSLTSQAYSISDEICVDSAQKKILQGTYNGTSEFVAEVNNTSELESIVYNNSQISGIYIYSENPTISNYKQYYKVTDEIAQSEWYQRAMKEGSAFWTSIEGENQYGRLNNNIALVRRIILPNNSYPAVVVIRLGDSYIRSNIDSDMVDAISIDDGNIVYSSKNSWYNTDMPMEIDYDNNYYSGVEIIEVDGNKYFSAVSTSNLYKTNSRLYLATLNGSYYYEIRRITSMLVGILAGAILIPGILLLLFARRFTERIFLLRKEMHKASVHDYDMLDKFPGNDEITEAYDDLKTMVSDIKMQEAMVYEAELNEKELRNSQQAMEYKMLASQINPHYLYNTLETIRMKALTMGNREVADCIKILGKTLKYVQQNTGATATTLKKEIDHVKNYLTIQKMRFGDRINYTLEFETGLEPDKYEVLPLLVQPIVENAVIHGLEGIDDGGIIEIKIYRVNGEQLRIVVKDNGKGMLPDECKKMQEKLATPGLKLESGIGIYNICERIRLHYGDEYGVSVESDYGEGTKVILTLPAIYV